MSFTTLGLSPELLSAIEAAGYSEPTPIQAKAIPQVLLGSDITGIAQTGTGKTAAFVLPIIDKLARGRARARMPRSLILAPTRELAAQVADNFTKYGINHKLTMALLIGGVSFADQDKLLMRGVDVLIATPGRLMDQFDRGKILLTGVELIVIDEADRMLDMGFIPDIEKIVSLLPPRRQTLLFSATMPPEITKLAKQFQKDPVRIEVTRPAQTADTITQYVIKLKTNDLKARRHALRAAIRSQDIQNGIVFCNRKREVDMVTKSLSVHGFDAAAIHGDLPQSYRTQTLDRFRNGELKLLVASDVAARGLDIPEVGHVFNFAPPPNNDDYVHRIGRTGRAGRSGESFTIVAPEDEKSWSQVLKLIGKDVKELVLDGLDAELEGLPKDEPRRGRRGRDSDRSRGGRGRARGSGSADKTQQRETVDAPLAENAKQASPSSDAQEKPRRERNSRRRDDDRNRRSKGDDELAPARDGNIVGMGDHVPDFLKK